MSRLLIVADEMLNRSSISSETVSDVVSSVVSLSENFEEGTPEREIVPSDTSPSSFPGGRSSSNTTNDVLMSSSSMESINEQDESEASEHPVERDTETIQMSEQPGGYWKVNLTDSREAGFVISPKNSQIIENIIASCKYEIGVPDCLNDHQFTRGDGSVIYYHSECGTFNDTVNNLSYHILDEQKNWISNFLFDTFTST